MASNEGLVDCSKLVSFETAKIHHSKGLKENGSKAKVVTIN